MDYTRLRQIKKGHDVMSKKITNVSYSWEKSSVKLNASEVDDERKEKWEKILGNKVFEMVKEENPSLLLFTKDKEEIDSDNLFSSKIESMYREYLDNFYGNTLKVEVESDPDIVFYPFFFSLFNFRTEQIINIYLFFILRK